MKLYGSPISSHTRRVRMFCDETGIEYTYQELDLLAGDQRTEAFLALNPNGKVPVIDDSGFVLNESHAIMRYLADTRSKVDWYPPAAMQRARIDAWLDWVHTRLGIEAGKLVFHNVLFPERRTPEQVVEAADRLTKLLPVMNDALEGSRRLAGDGATLADLAAVTAIADLDQARFDLEPYSGIRRWYGEIKALPSFTATRCELRR